MPACVCAFAAEWGWVGLVDRDGFRVRRPVGVVVCACLRHGRVCVHAWWLCVCVRVYVCVCVCVHACGVVMCVCVLACAHACVCVEDGLEAYLVRRYCRYDRRS